jgi:hypothetical protein
LLGFGCFPGTGARRKYINALAKRQHTAGKVFIEPGHNLKAPPFSGIGLTSDGGETILQRRETANS